MHKAIRNEEEHIKACLQSVQSHGLKRDPEVIVVDGGSSDRTIKIAKQNGAKVLSSPRGRGTQLNNGWKASHGDWCLFLHADSRVPENYGKSIEDALQSNPKSVWGCFDSIQTDVTGWNMDVISKGIQIRTRWFHVPYGDQAIFVKSTVLKKLGGIKNVRLLEDLDLVQRLKKNGFGPPALIEAPVFTSGRRWKEVGVWRTMLINQSILVGNLMGIESDRLADWYYFQKRKG